VCARRASTAAIWLLQQATAAVSLLVSLTLALLVYTVYAYCSLPSLRQPLLFDWGLFESIKSDYDIWLDQGLKRLRTDLEESAARR
jgi:hypothetical protein